MSPLPKGWRLGAREVNDPGGVNPQHPLASRAGLSQLNQMILADTAWCALTRPQQELLLSCVAGFPIRARADVQARVAAHGLITDDLQPTEAGRLVVQWRLP